MKRGSQLVALATALAAIVQPNQVSAQEAPLTADHEIFLTVEGEDYVRISASPSIEGLPVTVHAGTNVSGQYDWLADTNCPQDGGEGGFDFDCNVVYTITFDVLDSSDDFEFQWMTCETDPGEGFVQFSENTHGFYCLSGDPSAENGNNDVKFLYGYSGWEIDPVSVDPPEGVSDDILSVFEGLGGAWVWPHDRARYCGTTTDCLTAASQVNYFLTPQVDDTTDYTLSASEIVVPGGSPYPYSESWTWNDKTVRFASGQELIVSGEFHADGSTFEAASGTWDGIRFDTGSTGTLESTTITDVSTASGAVRVLNYYGGTTSVLFDDVLLDNPGAEYGIYATGYGSVPVVHNTSITGSSSGVLFTSSARGEMWQSVTEVDGIAVDADYYASPYLRPYPDHDEGGSNEIGGGYKGIRAQHTASVYAGDTTYPGDNEFCSGMESDADATSPAYIEARKNYWPGGYPNVGGNVVVNPYYEQASSCGGVGGKGLAGPVAATVGADFANSGRDECAGGCHRLPEPVQSGNHGGHSPHREGLDRGGRV